MVKAKLIWDAEIAACRRICTSPCYTLNDGLASPAYAVARNSQAHPGALGKWRNVVQGMKSRTAQLQVGAMLGAYAFQIMNSSSHAVIVLSVGSASTGACIGAPPWATTIAAASL